MPKFRASYSVLSAWERGDWQTAIQMYFKLDTPTNAAMEAGKEWHEKWAKHIEQNKTIPNEFNFKDVILKEPKTELKLVIELDDWLDLVGVIDCHDGDTIYEWKTGVQSSVAYSNGQQGGVYGLLAAKTGIPAKKCYIGHYNQHSKKPDVSMFWLTDKVIEEAENWIITIAGEMYEYFNTNNLWEQLGKKEG